jgi:hypothetical protein
VVIRNIDFVPNRTCSGVVAILGCNLENSPLNRKSRPPIPLVSDRESGMPV